MTRARLLPAMALLSSVLCPLSPALSQPGPQIVLRCHEVSPAALAPQLRERHGEERVVVGIASSGAMVMELYADRDRGGWSLALRLRDGRACILLVGSGFEELAPGRRVSGSGTR